MRFYLAHTSKTVVTAQILVPLLLISMLLYLAFYPFIEEENYWYEYYKFILIEKKNLRRKNRFLERLTLFLFFLQFNFGRDDDDLVHDFTA